MSDAAYDALYDELVALEEEHPELVTPDSPTQRVGAPPSDRFQKVQHLTPMGSLEKVTTDEALAKWADDVRKRLGTDEPVAYVLEPKIDGSAINLTYENGLFVRGATRGDGDPGRGRDRRTCARSRRSRCACSAATRRPLLEVRGEVYMPLSGFRELNERLAGRRQEACAESAQRRGRLAAAEGLRDHRGAAALDLGLRHGYREGVDARRRTGRRSQWLRERGFRTNPYAERLESIEEVAARVRRVGAAAHRARLRDRRHRRSRSTRSTSSGGSARSTSGRVGRARSSGRR